MKSITNTLESPQGVDSEQLPTELPTPDLATVKKWLVDDLGRCRSFLQALHDDPNIMQLVAQHLHGKIENFKNAEANKTKKNV